MILTSPFKADGRHGRYFLNCNGYVTVVDQIYIMHVLG